MHCNTLAQIVSSENMADGPIGAPAPRILRVANPAAHCYILGGPLAALDPSYGVAP